MIGYDPYEIINSHEITQSQPPHSPNQIFFTDGRLCPDDLENLRDWQVDPSLKVEMADILAPQGKDDLYLLAKSLRSAFPELLSTESKIVHPGDYIVSNGTTIFIVSKYGI